MTDSSFDAARVAQEVLATLRLIMADDDASDSARVAAAKILLERAAPKQDDETRAREADEREAAIAEIQGILADFAAGKSGRSRPSSALAKKRKAKSTHAAG